MSERLFFMESVDNNKKPRVVLNARGVKYDVLVKTLENCSSSSRLGKLKSCLENSEDLKDICDDFNLENLEFYFDRDPYILNSILNYCSIGELHLKDTVCVEFFSKELEYWGINIYEIKDCCISKYFRKKREIDNDIKLERKIIEDFKKKNENECLHSTRNKILKVITYEEKSWISRVNILIKIK
jgi:hypothetical protein